jgi:hypothetical protein
MAVRTGFRPKPQWTRCCLPALLAAFRPERQSGTAGLAVTSMQRADVRQLDVERQPDLTSPMFGCGQRKI